jgi:hypothetical protein
VLTFVTFKWKPKNGYRTTFTAEHVRILRSMLTRNYHGPMRFVCITDDASGLDDIETIKLWDEWANVPSVHGHSYPSCYRRLKLFAPDAHELLGVEPGSRVVAIDLDMVIVRDITPLFDRPEDIVLWGESDFKSQWYNGSLWMLKLGTRPKVYTAFDPKRSPSLAYRSGGRGSDQGWFTHILRPREATWGRADGVYSYRKHIYPPYGSGMLPDDATVVAFHGKIKPQDHIEQVAWIAEHYR